MYFFPEAAAAGRRRRPASTCRAGPVFVEFPGADRRRSTTAWRGPRELLARDAAGGRRWVCPHSTYLLDEAQLRAVGELAADAPAPASTSTPARRAAELGAGPRSPRPHADRGAPRHRAARPGHGARPRRPPHRPRHRPHRRARRRRRALPGVEPEAAPAASPASPSCSPPACPWRSAPTARRRPTTSTCGWRCASPPTRWRRAPASGRSPPRDVLAMATTGGRTAPAATRTIGSIEVGTRADLVVLDPSVACAHARPTTRCRPPPTRPRGATSAGSSPAGGSSSTTGGSRRSTSTPPSPPSATSAPGSSAATGPMNVEEARHAVHAACRGWSPTGS